MENTAFHPKTKMLVSPWPKNWQLIQQADFSVCTNLCWCHVTLWHGPKTCVPKLGQVIYHIYGPILGAEMQLLTCPVNSASIQSLSGLWAIWILISVLPRPFSTLETLRCFCILFEHEITRKLLEMINVNGFKIRYNSFSYSAQKQTLNLGRDLEDPWQMLLRQPNTLNLSIISLIPSSGICSHRKS